MDIISRGNHKEICVALADGHIEATFPNFLRVVKINCLPAVKIFIERKIDICAGGNYALYMSAANGHTEIVKLLLENGANPNNYCSNSFIDAVTNNHVEIVKMLIEHGTNIYADYDYVLKYSIEKENTEMVAILLEHKNWTIR